MTDNTRLTPAAVAAALAGDLPNAIRAATPGGIEAQEAQGQQDFVNSTTLPIGFYNREQFEQMGIVFGEPVDDLFCEAQLPQGWRKERTDHSMYSNLLDDQGRKRASMFYKAAFYDRRADLSITARFHTKIEPIGGWGEQSETAMWHCVVFDGNKAIWASDPIGPEAGRGVAHEVFLEWMDTKDACAKLGRAWLDEHYPNWSDPTAYWD